MAAADSAAKLTTALTALDALADELEDYSDNSVQGHMYRNELARRVRFAENLLSPRTNPKAIQNRTGFDPATVCAAVDAANPS